MEEWAAKIIRGQNGYIFEYEDELDDGSFRKAQYVIQDDDSDELKSHEELLWEVVDYFGFRGSKHDKERLRITREKGA